MNTLIKAQTSPAARAVAAAVHAAMEKHRYGLDAPDGAGKQKQTGPELLIVCFGQIIIFSG